MSDPNASLTTNEPVAVLGALQGFAVAAVGVFTVVFDLSPATVVSITSLLAAGVLLLTAVARSKVTPVANLPAGTVLSS